MKLGFVHSHRFKTYEEAIYSEGKLPYAVWQRYLKHFDALVVMARKEPIVAFDQNRFNISSGPNVSFVWLPELGKPSRYYVDSRQARNILRKQIGQLDAVVIRLSGLGWIAASECEQQDKPWAVEVVGDAWDALWNYGTLAGRLYAPIIWWNSRKWIRKAKFAIYVTRETLQRRYPCTGYSCGISDVEIQPVEKAVLDRRLAKRNISAADKSERATIGMIASLANRYKGLHIAMRALAELRREGIQIELRVLGSGNIETCRQEAEVLGVVDAIHFDGSLPGGAPVMEWLDALDCYIQPSLQEGLPRALIEAMSRGLPALGSRCGGIPELLPAECLHTPGDHRKLAQDIKRMIKEPAWREKMAIRNFDEAKLYYADTISARRDAFWAEFAAYAKDIKMKH